MDTDVDDEHERPTVPNPDPRAFEGEVERFFLAGDGAFDPTVTLDACRDDDVEDITAWWVEQRRRALVRTVATTMLALGAGLLAAWVLPPVLG